MSADQQLILAHGNRAGADNLGSPFLRFPPEIRLKIYEDLLTSRSPALANRGERMVLVVENDQVRNEHFLQCCEQSFIYREIAARPSYSSTRIASVYGHPPPLHIQDSKY